MMLSFHQYQSTISRLWNSSLFSPNGDQADDHVQYPVRTHFSRKETSRSRKEVVIDARNNSFDHNARKDQNRAVKSSRGTHLAHVIAECVLQSPEAVELETYSERGRERA